MAGGTFVTYNKIRPGAYINFIAKPQPLLQLSDRGIATVPLAMTWGPELGLIDMVSSDLVDGTSLSKIGYSAIDLESLPYRLVLTGCSRCKFFNLASGGSKSEATLGAASKTFKATAKYHGTTGNKIAVVIVKDKVSEGDTQTYTVTTLFRNLEMDKQSKLSKPTDLIDNDYIDWDTTSTAEFAETAATNLEGGENGTVDEETAYPLYFKAIKNEIFNTMGIPTDSDLVKAAAELFIKDLRENEGVKVQCVLYDYNKADYEGIIESHQGYEDDIEVVDPVNFVLWVTGITAGADINQSNTAKVIPGATKIIGELSNTEIIDALQKGRFLITKRRDGAIKVEKDINTLYTFTSKKSYDFSKNRVIRVLDEVGNTVSLTWDKSYCGKLDNEDEGRKVFKADLINYGNILQGVKAITNFLGSDDIECLPGPAVDDVIVNWPIQPVDSMEKLYATFTVGKKA